MLVLVVGEMAFRRLLGSSVGRVPRRRFGAAASEGAAVPIRLGHRIGSRPEPEEWEFITKFSYAAATVITVVGLSLKPETDLKVWGRDEAVARIRSGEEATLGDQIQPNTSYVYDKNGPGEMPTLVVKDEE